MRWNVDHWMKKWNGPVRVLSLWIGSPRSGAKYFSATHIGDAEWISCKRVRGWDITHEMAWEDGFGGASDLLRALCQINHKTMHEVLEHEWVVLKWGTIIKPQGTLIEADM